jgi:epoxyqueuosine reductase
MITVAIGDFCRGPNNTLLNEQNEAAWGQPLIGFSRGDNPLYAAYKEFVGPFHWTPLEIFQQTFPDSPVEPGELTVICWILPQTDATRADNRQERVYPAERWARSRVFGEAFNSRLRAYVVGQLTAMGYQAVAPALTPQWQTRTSDRYVFASTWSERHAAHASGLGTFGLCDGLITPLGKAVRIGSAIVRGQVPYQPQSYSDHRAYCLFFSEGTCGDCMSRCPVGAITRSGHDKVKCQKHLSRTEGFVREHYGFDGYGCGLCQTGVPCESGIPPRTKG